VDEEAQVVLMQVAHTGAHMVAVEEVVKPLVAAQVTVDRVQ
jgi:hypothetical protein